MIALQHTYLSDDIAEQFFVCDLDKCKGACCLEGDAGAPLEPDERAVLEDIYEAVRPYLSAAGVAAIEAQGKWVLEKDGDFGTPTVNDRECAYATYDYRGKLQCGIERAYLDGKTAFRKPISCHLYPIRISKYEQYEAVNYERWGVCSPACALGKSLGVPLYQFLREPLIRKYGEDWYAELTRLIATRQA